MKRFCAAGTNILRVLFVHCLALGFCFAAAANDSLRLATWNIRYLSDGSRDDAEIQTIAAILNRYDLVAVQEARDHRVLGRLAEAAGPDWRFAATDAVGRSQKEVYAFFYRSPMVELLAGPAPYPDVDDQFIREPAAAAFRAGSFDFTLLTAHLHWGSLSDRRIEASLLDQVARYFADLDGPELDLIVLGDFNLPAEDAAWNMGAFRALVPAKSWTTISDTGSYDNIWLSEATVCEYAGGLEIFHFDEQLFDADDRAASLAVSDHRPVSALFRIDGPDDDPEGSWDW